jgi:hypothetical protein
VTKHAVPIPNEIIISVLVEFMEDFLRTRASARKRPVPPGSKLEIISKLLHRKQGCTRKEVLVATGWPAVSMPDQARQLGITLKTEKQDGVTRYWAS